ncbi:hypothetical protein BX592_113119 [Paraburkholderia rhizosphaerae]|uniref:Uncharacterized protein n=1 Tax=Paraburkholderia rhizosphaerae TaxID=480658 RepID=A0A4R8LMC2_9BURK|nr:hypothetical protein BX592_113119 [Paraburkholderia rhizosphaerae]
MPATAAMPGPGRDGAPGFFLQGCLDQDAEPFAPRVREVAANTLQSDVLHQLGIARLAHAHDAEQAD